MKKNDFRKWSAAVGVVAVALGSAGPAAAQSDRKVFSGEMCKDREDPTSDLLFQPNGGVKSGAFSGLFNVSTPINCAVVRDNTLQSMNAGWAVAVDAASGTWTGEWRITLWSLVPDGTSGFNSVIIVPPGTQGLKTFVGGGIPMAHANGPMWIDMTLPPAVEFIAYQVEEFD